MATKTTLEQTQQERLGEQAGAESFALALSVSATLCQQSAGKYPDQIGDAVRAGDVVKFSELAEAQSAQYVAAHDCTTRSGAKFFHVGFVRGFNSAARDAHLALPEVKRANAERRLRRRIENALSSAATALQTFSERLKENPLYAFEWADAAFEAAADQNVALALLSVLDTNGVDAALAYAQRSALQGARSPKFSTSQATNVADRYKTAAFASYLDVFEY